MTREVIGLFLADTPQRLQAIEAAVAARDPQALATAAHALKGSAGNVGATALHTLAGTMEASAKKGWPENAAAQAARLQSLWEGTRQAIDSWTAG